MVKRETSYGVIPLQRRGRGWRVLMVFHEKGFWAFPKGHADRGEEGQCAAERELREETGLLIDRYLDIPPFEEHYFFRHQGTVISKTVFYWVALVKGRIQLQESEIADSRWVALKKADELATFPQAKELCRQLQSFM